jgi:hypothetical protein
MLLTTQTLHRSRDVRIRCAPPVAILAAILGIAGCATSEGPEITTRQGLGCVDDSSDCVAKRQAALRELVADKDRKWMKDQPTAASYASGVRLFAYKTKKKELTCEELSAGRREADGAPAVLRGPQATQLTPAQASRGIMLAGEVSRELGSEYARRCKKT